MTPTELADRMREPRPRRIALDTNVIGGQWGGFKGFATRCRRVLKARHLCGHRGGAGFRLFVSALVHGEVLFDLRLERGDDFDPTIIDEGLRSLEVDVEPFDCADAEHLASRLWGRFASPDQWSAAKWSRVRFGREDQPGRSCPATVDWWIASHVRDDGWIITDDRGIEFRGSNLLRADVFDAALQLLCGE